VLASRPDEAVRAHAQTYSQLAVQAEAAGLDDARLVRLRRAHDLAQAMVDGMYRAHGAPFLCHLVRTASILLAEDQPQPVIEAGMLHAAYLLHEFEGSRRTGRRAPLRRRLMAGVGPEVEALVRTYAGVRWRSAEDGEARLAALPDADGITRGAVAIAVANELEDHLDGARRYMNPPLDPVSLATRMRVSRALAETLGMHELAAELDEVHRAVALPVRDALRTSRTVGYELPRGASWRAGAVELWLRRWRRRRKRSASRD
jgi:hypothetical protein